MTSFSFTDVPDRVTGTFSVKVSVAVTDHDSATLVVKLVDSGGRTLAQASKTYSKGSWLSYIEVPFSGSYSGQGAIVGELYAGGALVDKHSVPVAIGSAPAPSAPSVTISIDKTKVALGSPVKVTAKASESTEMCMYVKLDGEQVWGKCARTPKLEALVYIKSPGQHRVDVTVDAFGRLWRKSFTVEAVQTLRPVSFVDVLLPREVTAGQPAQFLAVFDNPNSTAVPVKLDVYVNGNFYGSVTGSAEPGRSTVPFAIKFDAPGTYTVEVVAYMGG